MIQYSGRQQGCERGTDLKFGGGRSAIEKLIPEAEDEPDRRGHSADGYGSLSSRIDRENDFRSETKHGSVQPMGWTLANNAQPPTQNSSYPQSAMSYWDARSAFLWVRIQSG